MHGPEACACKISPVNKLFLSGYRNFSAFVPPLLAGGLMESTRHFSAKKKCEDGTFFKMGFQIWILRIEISLETYSCVFSDFLGFSRISRPKSRRGRFLCNRDTCFRDA